MWHLAYCKDAAVKIVDFLQGKWLGHPLHPALVHLPVGLWTVACGVDIAVRAGVAEPGLSRLAMYCVAIGLLGAIAAVPPGIADWSSIKKEKPAWKIGLVHMILNGIAAVVWAFNLVWRWNAADPTGVSDRILYSSIVATVLVFVSGYLGTLLVFDHGVSVARLSKKKWREIAVRGGARVPEEKG